METISVATAVIAIVGSLLVAYCTARWQIRAAERDRGINRKYEIYDEFIKAISDLSLNLSLSLKEGYLIRVYSLSGMMRSYASRDMAMEAERFVTMLRDNYASYTQELDRLHGQWFEGEPQYTMDGVYCGVEEVLVNGDNEGYEKECANLASQSALSADEVHNVLVRVSNHIRKEVGNKEELG